ncbi:hypothetical protein [Streptomyces sp. YS415]|uniref:hypothetical protein n=1 Tax=Streptomyces sp. YS415 TaxID=2944806 RepID=UPI0020207CC4|nr:hypothetical protein [Streptomyces sp. YS415]MCL7430322.1 hypothetical protein [Streptomyces sp. YS415]
MYGTRFSPEEKKYHLLRWASGWSGGERGESMWSYALRLGGSHALLNGWAKNPNLLQALTPEERRMLETARRRASCAGRTRPQRSRIAAGPPARTAE